TRCYRDWSSDVCSSDLADSAVLYDITKRLAGKLYADKGYIGKELFRKLWQRGLHLITGIRRNMIIKPPCSNPVRSELPTQLGVRSEERRVGQECRYRM